MEISANFDGGNILFDSARQSDSENHAYLRIRTDLGAEFLQWFYFRAQNVKFQHLVIHITNASEAFSSEGWKGYQDKGHLRELKEFARSVIEGEPLPISLEDLLKATETSFIVDRGIGA